MTLCANRLCKVNHSACTYARFDFPIASKTKGKSGGARVITHTVLMETDGANITLVTIYDKSDMASISNHDLRKLMKKNGLE